MAKKAKKSLAEASNEMYTLLESFNSEERARIVSGTLTLLGDPVSAQVSAHAGGTGGAAVGAGSAARLPVLSATTGGARPFLDGKAPKGKNELFAAAARFHELNNNGAPPTKADFANIIHTQSRRNFHARNFARDMDNAERAGFFNRGGSAEGGYPLSNVGQEYVDALPDREKALAARAAGRAGTRKKVKKRKAKTAPKK